MINRNGLFQRVLKCLTFLTWLCLDNMSVAGIHKPTCFMHLKDSTWDSWADWRKCLIGSSVSDLAHTQHLLSYTAQGGGANSAFVCARTRQWGMITIPCICAHTQVCGAILVGTLHWLSFVLYISSLYAITLNPTWMWENWLIGTDVSLPCGLLVATSFVFLLKKVPHR